MAVIQNFARLAAVTAVVVAVAGCDAASSRQVSTQSIVRLPSGFNLLQNATFAGGASGGWLLTGPPDVTQRVGVEHGVRVLTLTGTGKGRVGPVTLVQQPSLLPRTQAGSTYVLEVRIRTLNLTRPVRVELKFNYSDGGYEFFPAHPVAGPVESDSTLFGSTRGWVTLRARATAPFPLASIQVFLLDSLATPKLSGSVALEEPRLFVAGIE